MNIEDNLETIIMISQIGTFLHFHSNIYKYNISSIEGWISQVDNDHLERLYHFYEKFGFEIIPNSERMKIADIRLSIEE